MVLDSAATTSPEKLSSHPAAHQDKHHAVTNRSDQSAWNESNAINTANAHQIMSGMGLNNFQVSFAQDNPNPPSVDLVMPRDGGLDQTRDKLAKAADKVLSPEQAAEFKKNMKQFEERAQKDHLSNEEIQSTYEATERLFSAKNGAATEHNMHLLATQVMAEAANPNKARTGHATPSCGPVGLESLMYQNHPAQAADLLTQAAITGKFKTSHGYTVQADITPTYETAHPDEHSQLYSSQIFQSVALNAGLKEAGDDRTFHMEYGQVTDGSGAFYVDSQGKGTPFLGTTDDLMLSSYSAITGKDDLVMIENGQGESTRNIRFVNSPEEMQKAVSDLAAKNIPTLVELDARNQPFWTQAKGSDLGPADPNGNYAHWISLKGYDSSTGAVTYHNGWDDVDHQISPTDLFRSTRQADQNLIDMSHDFVDSLQNKNGNYAEALEALRIRSEAGRITYYDLNRLLNRDVDGLIAQRGEHFMDDETTRRTILEITNNLFQKNPKALKLSPQFLHYFDNWTLSHQND